MSILPQDTINIENIIEDTKEDTKELPLFKEYAWDFKENKFIYENGKMKVLEGKEALKVWIYKTLKTPRFRYKAYSSDYGQEFEELIGMTLSNEALKIEAERYLKECLLINPYITNIKNINVLVEKDVLKIDATIDTVYGEVEISV